jgi:hypothetical protein
VIKRKRHGIAPENQKLEDDGKPKLNIRPAALRRNITARFSHAAAEYHSSLQPRSGQKIQLASATRRRNIIARFSRAAADYHSPLQPRGGGISQPGLAAQRPEDDSPARKCRVSPEKWNQSRRDDRPTEKARQATLPIRVNPPEFGQEVLSHSGIPSAQGVRFSCP